MTSPAEHAATVRRADAERTFNPSACERLAASNREYQDSHGYYLPALAWLLNETRTERDALAARADELERERDEERERATENGRLAQTHWDRAERAETALRRIECLDVDWTQGVDENAELLKDIARAALGEQPPITDEGWNLAGEQPQIPEHLNDLDYPDHEDSLYADDPREQP